MAQTKQVNLIILILLLFININCKKKENNITKSKSTVKETLNQKFTVKSKILTIEEFDTVLNSGIIDNINYIGNLILCYEFSDKSGEYYLILTQKDNQKSIYAYCAKKDVLETELDWNINDSIMQTEFSEEYEINFLKKFITVSDIDNDGLVDVILTYMAQSKDDYDRLKIIIKHGNSTIKIIHYGASLDDERETKIDKSFFSLPKSFQEKVYIDLKKINTEILGINSDVLDKVGSNLN